MDEPTFIALQNFRKATWVIVVGCTAFLLAASLLWLATFRLRREHAIFCLMVGASGAVLGLSLGVAWNNNDMGFWAAYTVGHAVLAATLLVVVAISFLGMWRK